MVVQVVKQINSRFAYAIESIQGTPSASFCSSSGIHRAFQQFHFSCQKQKLQKEMIAAFSAVSLFMPKAKIAKRNNSCILQFWRSICVSTEFVRGFFQRNKTNLQNPQTHIRCKILNFHVYYMKIHFLKKMEASNLV